MGVQVGDWRVDVRGGRGIAADALQCPPLFCFIGGLVRLLLLPSQSGCYFLEPVQFVGEFHCLCLQVVGALAEETILQSASLLPHLLLNAQLHSLLTDIFLHQPHQLIANGLPTTASSPVLLPQGHKQHL